MCILKTETTTIALPHLNKKECCTHFHSYKYLFDTTTAHWKEEGRKYLIYDTLNTFYLWLYYIRHMVKDHSGSKRGNLLPPHGLLFSISSKLFFYMHPTDRITHTMAFVTPAVEHWWYVKTSSCTFLIDNQYIYAACH